MRHFEIYLNSHKIILSAEIMKTVPSGQTYFYNSLSENLLHIAPIEAMIIDVTKEYVFENALDKTINIIEEFYNSLDDRITNDIPIEDKKTLRKESAKFHEFAKNLIEIKEQINKI